MLGCDSVLDLDGAALGKPADADRRGRALARDARTQPASCVTGHCLVDVRGDAVARRATVARRPRVRFADPTDAEIEAYVATGEPLRVAGAFTIDGLGGWFVDGVDGAPSNVVGLSLPLLRGLLAELGIRSRTWPAFADR